MRIVTLSETKGLDFSVACGSRRMTKTLNEPQ